MQCSKCNYEMWDNRERKAQGKLNPKAPDFKCKNQNCDFVIWKADKEEVKQEVKQEIKDVKPVSNEDDSKNLALLTIASQIVVGKMHAGYGPPDPLIEIGSIYKRLKEII